MTYSKEELAHYGIKGMKWGVSRSDIASAGQKAASVATTAAIATKKGAVVAGRGAVKTGKAVNKAAKWAVHHKKMVAGGIIAADILVEVGSVAMGYGKSGILMKAAANRKAAYEAGKLAARAITATAASVPYAKISRGAYKITTM